MLAEFLVLRHQHLFDEPGMANEHVFLEPQAEGNHVPIVTGAAAVKAQHVAAKLGQVAKEPSPLWPWGRGERGRADARSLFDASELRHSQTHFSFVVGRRIQETRRIRRANYARGKGFCSDFFSRTSRRMVRPTRVPDMAARKAASSGAQAGSRAIIGAKPIQISPVRKNRPQNRAPMAKSASPVKTLIAG